MVTKSLCSKEKCVYLFNNFNVVNTQIHQFHLCTLNLSTKHFNYDLIIQCYPRSNSISLEIGIKIIIGQSSGNNLSINAFTVYMKT